MQLSSCPACNSQVSPAAKSCPGCGHPLVMEEPTTKNPSGAIAAIIVALITGGSAFLPWIEMGALSRSGVPGDGYIVLGASVVAGLVGLNALQKGFMGRGTGLVILLCGLLAGWIGKIDYQDVSGRIELLQGSIFGGAGAVGPGLYGVLIGAFCMCVLGLVVLVGGERVAS